MLRVIFLMCFASTASAESPLSIEKFRAIVEGNAYFHAFDQGPPFGTQFYGSGNGLIWWDHLTEYVYGHYEAGPEDQICAVFDELAYTYTYCWTFYATETGFRAIGEDGKHFVMTQTTAPLPCQEQIQS